MAERVILVDDLTGEKLDVATVSFSVQGAPYELDLAAKNRDALRAALAPFIRAARTTEAAAGSAGRLRPMRRVETGVDPRAVRAWAASNGIRVSPRGHIPKSVVERFRAAGY